jgi:hypothetical protein
MSALPPTNNAPTPGSNAAKNKKKRDKKKAKKKAATGSNAQPEITTPSLTDKDTSNPSSLKDDTISQEPTTTESEPLSGEASLTASSLPAAPIEDSTPTLGNTTASEVTPLSGASSAMAVSLPAPPIEEEEEEEENTPINSYVNKPSTTTDTTPIIKDSASLSRIPATGPVGTGALGATAAGAAVIAATVDSAAADLKTTKSNSFVPLPETFTLSDNVHHCIQSTIASRSIDLDSIISTITKNIQLGDYKEKAKLPDEVNAKYATIIPTTNKDNTKKTTAEVGATLAGSDTAIAGATKASKPEVAKQTKLSDNVQQCIKSAIQAPSANVESVPPSSEELKRPEPAAGALAQPVMPSSAKTPDIPKKEKPSERRHKSAFRNKKKDCIIL